MLAPQELEVLQQRWDGLCERVGAFATVEESEMTFELVRTMYEHPPRTYHTLEHIAHCLRVFDRVTMLADHPDALEFALWLHDAVYIPERHDNEARSADGAGMIAGLLGCPPDFAEEVRSLVLVTKHDSCPVGGDAALVADIDLAILGAEPDAYEQYRRQIRNEFVFADEEQYRQGRAAALHKFLDRPHIYANPYIRGVLEQQAIENLQTELDDLTHPGA
ncbi:MAG: N-methyl-D-aspartate receptor NMDAR2C subunit [Planctomycetota bacterium]